jgi:hypothetical protein
VKPASVALALAAFVSVVAWRASPARADSQAEAVALFDQGIKDMKAGRLDKACAELSASLDLVKDSGTKGALARCHGLAGRVATAWLLWRELADTAPTAALRADAAAQATKLEPRLPRYTIKLAGRTPNLVVEINGKAVAAHVPVAVPIDPGKLSITASGRDGDRVVTETWTHDDTAVEGETLEIEIPPLAPRPVSVKKPVKPRRDVTGEIADRRHRRHVIALLFGGVALGAAGAGTYEGLGARSKFAEAKQTCGGVIDQCPTDAISASKQQVDDARRLATRSNVLFGGAGAAMLVATIVWFSAPSLEAKGVAVAPTIGSGTVGLALGGAF